MSPITHISVDPALKDFELFQPELAFELASEVGHRVALVEFAASPQFLEDEVPFGTVEVSEADT